MKPEIRQAFEMVCDTGGEYGLMPAKPKSDTAIRREATLLIKRVEQVIENLPDQSMTVGELYEEIAGTAWRG